MRASVNASRAVRGGPAPRGFTLIELLIVIGIIAVLVSMAVVVGSKVIEGGKARATQNVIRTLDQTLGGWTLNADTPLPGDLVFEDPRSNSTREYRYPLIDANIDGTNVPTGFSPRPWPSISFYTALVMQDASIASDFQAIDSAFVSPSQGPPADTNTGNPVAWAIPALAVQDAWGRPIRLVHPAYHGGHGDYWDAEAGRMENRDLLEGVVFSTDRGSLVQANFRRSYRPFRDDQNRKASDIGDADEGMCVGGTPYFYSAGEDGDPGGRADNVYSTVPRFPVETRDFE